MGVEIFWYLLINKMVPDLCMSVVNGTALFHLEAEKSGIKAATAERVMQVEIFWCPLISKMVLDMCMSVVNGATLFSQSKQENTKKWLHSGPKWNRSCGVKYPGAH